MPAIADPKSLADLVAELPAVLTCESIARVLGVSANSIRNWVREGKFPRPISQLGNTPKWSRAVVVRYLRQIEAA